MGLIALAVSDLLYCLCSFPRAFKDHHEFGTPNINFWLVYDTYGNALINCFLVSSSWLIVMTALIRYFAICHPLQANRILNQKSSRNIIIAVFLLSLLFNLPRFWMKKISYVECLEGGRSYFNLPAYMDSNNK